MPDHDRLLARRNALAASLGRPPVDWPTHVGATGQVYPNPWLPCARCDGAVTVPPGARIDGLLCWACRDELAVELNARDR